MNTPLLLLLTILFLWITSGIVRTTIKYIKSVRNKKTYTIVDRIVDTLWIDRFVYLFIAYNPWDENDPYNFDDF